MTLDEYKQKIQENDEWAPGWEAVDSCMEKLYGNQRPKHYGTNILARALFGGDQYLDGCSIYRSQHRYWHIVTYGMSALYADEHAFGGEFSKWGYEMTIKLPGDAEGDFMWAIDMLANLARYTFTSQRYLEPQHYISGGGKPIRAESNSRLTGLLVVEDTELKGADTIHGRLDFLQLVGITQTELDAISSDREQISILIERMKQENPYLITDVSRIISYV